MAIQARSFKSQMEVQTELLIRGSFLFCAISFALLLIYTYWSFTVARFAYMGYEWRPSWPLVATGLMLICVLCMMLPSRLRRPGDLMLWILFCVVILPSLVLPSVSSRLSIDNLAVYQMALTVCFLALLAANGMPLIKGVGVSLFSHRAYSLLLLALLLLICIPIAVFWGIPTSLPSLDDVYTVRLANRTIAAAAPGFVGYLFGWLVGVVAPITLIWGIVTRRWYLLASALFAYLFIYGLTGMRSALFMPVLMLAVATGVAILRGRLAVVILPGVLGIGLFASFFSLLFSYHRLTALFVNRAFIVPGVLAGYYFEYFTNNPPANWAHSFVGLGSSSQYGQTPPRIIGAWYYRNPDTNANASFFSDGYANLNWVGMAFATAVVALLIVMLNSVSDGKSVYLIFPIAVRTIFQLNSGSVFMELLTGGIWLVIVLVILMPREREISTDVGSAFDRPPLGKQNYQRVGVKSVAASTTFS